MLQYNDSDIIVVYTHAYYIEFLTAFPELIRFFISFTRSMPMIDRYWKKKPTIIIYTLVGNLRYFQRYELFVFLINFIFDCCLFSIDLVWNKLYIIFIKYVELIMLMWYRVWLILVFYECPPYLGEFSILRVKQLNNWGKRCCRTL